MKKIIIILAKIVTYFWALMFILFGFGGIIACTIAENTGTLVSSIILSALFLIIGAILFYIASKKIVLQNFEKKDIPTNDCDNNAQVSISVKSDISITNKHVENSFGHIDSKADSIEKPSDQYIETASTIQHTDGKPFSDEEVPYLMQLSYEKALQREGIYEGKVFDISGINEDLPRKKSQTAIPLYQELRDISPNTSNVPISSTDIFFLKYLDGRVLEDPNIAQYWYYEYDINYSDEIKKLISSGLLTISQINLKKFKVDDLKNILRHFELPLSGKKADLQKRILENIRSEELSSFLDDTTHYFSITDKGNTFAEAINNSATFNLELENEAISLILDYDYENAFDLIWNFKKQTPAGKNISYQYHLYTDNEYDSIMTPGGFFYTLEKDRDIEMKIRASMVFCRMYGSGQDNIRKLIARIYKENGHEFSNDAKNIISSRLL